MARWHDGQVTERFEYRVHGLAVQSDVAFPTWPRSSFPLDDAWSLTVERGDRTGSPINRDTVRGWWVTQGDPRAPDYLELNLVAAEDPTFTSRIAVDARKRTIEVSWTVDTVSALEGAEYLLTVRVLPALARLFDDALPLHGTVVQRDGLTLLICGDSGAGKSTLSSYFLSQPGTVVSDEPAVVRVVNDRLVVSPGPFALRVHDESEAAASLVAAGYQLIESGDKVAAVSSEPRFSDDPIPVSGIATLTARDPDASIAAISALNPLDASLALMRQRYCSKDPVILPAEDFVLSAAISSVVPVYTVTMPDSMDSLAASADRVWSIAADRVSSSAAER